MTLRDKMLAVIADVNASVAEREELVEMIAIALLTRKNLFVLGEPGQAKSYAINLFRRHITGARQFERLLSKQSDEEQLFGRVDLARVCCRALCRRPCWSRTQPIKTSASTCVSSSRASAP